MKKKITKILIANRGEIASRIIATCKEMGIATVAVYSKHDAALNYVKEASCSILLEGDSLKETYLNIDQIIKISLSQKVDAIHPGYGFLSENADFAQAVVQANIIFIGPHAETIQKIGNKAASKTLLAPLGVSLIPGYYGADQTLSVLLAAAQKIGLPLLIKAAAGGGGKGMKIVTKWDDFAEAVEMAKVEAQKSFGDDQVMIEKYIQNPRHIELQVFADIAGTVVFLADRDCSLQRRHQKVIEEAPAPKLKTETRQAIQNDGLTIVKCIQYLNAGTLEFVVGEDGQHYFLEMNTRLQVEHPVSELIFGLDFVKLQILIAQGETSPWLVKNELQNTAPSTPVAHGHAMEVRVYAEAADRGFLPTCGKIEKLVFSKIKGVRYDFTYAEKQEVTTQFDPMLGKVIVHAENRTEAIQKLIAALKDTVILGFQTNIPFLIACLSLPEFRDGHVSTGFISAHLAKLLELSTMPPERADFFKSINACWNENLPSTQGVIDPWMQCALIKPENYSQEVIATKQGLLQWMEKDKNGCKIMQQAYYWNDQRKILNFYFDGKLFSYSKKPIHLLKLSGANGGFDAGETLDQYTAISPMPGKVSRILRKSGETVAIDEIILVLEAMKMEHPIKSKIKGIVTDLNIKTGDQVKTDDRLFSVTTGSKNEKN